MYLLEKLAARGVDYLHFSVGATLRPSIVDTSDPTPLIEKYCAMRSDTPRPGAGDGRRRVRTPPMPSRASITAMT